MIVIKAYNDTWDLARKIQLHSAKAAAEYARLLINGGWIATPSRYGFSTKCDYAIATLNDDSEIAIFDCKSRPPLAHLSPFGETVIGVDRRIVRAAVAAYNAAVSRRVRRAKKNRERAKAAGSSSKEQ